MSDASRSKYHAVPTIVNGIRFASRREARRYGVLILAERVGQISDLRLHTQWPLQVNGVTVAYYVDDFSYYRDGAFVVEDAKGVQTPVFRLKRRMFRAEYGFDITLS